MEVSERNNVDALDSVTWEVVDRFSDLERICDGWHSRAADGSLALAVDTEFVRERTFYPHLGLLQVADDRGIFLLDTEEIEDLTPFAEILSSSSITKVLHSCSEDLEVFHYRLGVLPESLFDSQIAAGFAGMRASMGYGALVEAFFRISLPKEHTRSNWLRRPLTSAQLRYAALDVAYLRQIHQRLVATLDDLDRRSWVEEDTQRLLAPSRFEDDGDAALYRKIGRSRRMGSRQLAVLRGLCAWRGQEARQRDLPRNFVVPEAALAALSQQQPKTPRELARIRELDSRKVKRYGDTLLDLVDAARSLPQEDLPHPFARGADLAPHKQKVKEMRAKVVEIADELDLAPELLATRRAVESLLRRFLDRADPVLPKALRGWREEIVGLPLLALLD